MVGCSAVGGSSRFPGLTSLRGLWGLSGPGQVGRETLRGTPLIIRVRRTSQAWETHWYQEEEREEALRGEMRLEVRPWGGA